jgi:hypothetical protein
MQIPAGTIYFRKVSDRQVLNALCAIPIVIYVRR